GGQYPRHQYRLERLSALVLNDHAYDKLTGWSNVIPVVPVKGDATESLGRQGLGARGLRLRPDRRRACREGRKKAYDPLPDALTEELSGCSSGGAQVV